METYDDHKRHARSRLKKYGHDDHYHSKDHNQLSFGQHDLQLEQQEEQQRHHCRHHKCHRRHRSKSKVSTTKAATRTKYLYYVAHKRNQSVKLALIESSFNILRLSGTEEN